MRMEPLWGAGMLRMLIGGEQVLLWRIWRWRRRRGGIEHESGRMVALYWEFSFLGRCEHGDCHSLEASSKLRVTGVFSAGYRIRTV